MVLVREGYEVTRYADDLVIQCKTEQEAHAALARLREELVGRGLTLHPDKTRVTHVRRRGGFDFLGYHFEQSWRRPKKQAHESAARRVPDAPRETDPADGAPDGHRGTGSARRERGGRRQSTGGRPCHRNARRGSGLRGHGEPERRAHEQAAPPQLLTLRPVTCHGATRDLSRCNP
ncbi:reverse transcriptase domain-containing protein [Sorangium sp. So ce363]|uniref:reverse transcriptase domain-containing protein n=1 Tax=Sorangium sp. So ce363 TaxID=3133304 RepID=UPI003F640EA0